MQAKIQKLSRLIWTFKQPLTHKPAVEAVPVSDLFVWRCGPEWDTFFELINLPALFEDGNEVVPHMAKLIFFNAAGHRVVQKEILLAPNKRQTLRLSEVIGASHGEMGTFAVFHTVTPENISNLGSFITERGYLSYQYRDAPLRAYVHGNLDAVALLPDSHIQMLGGYGILKRRYFLQHVLEEGKEYELILVNPTASTQTVNIKLMSFDDQVLHKESACLPSLGCCAVIMKWSGHPRAKVVVDSHMVMARPVVFKINDGIIDVFHG